LKNLKNLKKTEMTTNTDDHMISSITRERVNEENELDEAEELIYLDGVLYKVFNCLFLF
jgi:hypothetical protein